MLVDDDDLVNYLNKDLINQLDIAHEITTCVNGQQALDYLA